MTKRGPDLNLRGVPMPQIPQQTQREVVAQGAELVGETVRIPASFKPLGDGCFRRGH